MQDLDKPDKLAVLAADTNWRSRLLVEEGDYGLFATLEKRYETLDL